MSIQTVKLQEDKIVLQKVLKRLRDNEDGFRFEGEISNGKIEGMYSPFLLQNRVSGMVLSTLKIGGSYNLDRRQLEFKLQRGLMFFVMLFFVFVFWLLAFIIYFDNSKIWEAPLAFAILGFFALLITLVVHEYEKWKFKEYIRTVLNQVSYQK